jgi:hypothetical protein
MKLQDVLCVKVSRYYRKIELRRNKSMDTKKTTDTQERKKLKRAARKKAAPKAKREYPRGSQKKKVKTIQKGARKR